MGSSIKIFSFFYNCKMLFIYNKDVNLNKIVNKVHFNRQSKYIIDLCTKITNKINNNHFSLYDFKMYMIIMYLLNEKVNWKDINIDDIAKISKQCSNKQFMEDNAFLLSLVTKVNITFPDLYKVNSNGNNILLDLILEKKISPLYYIVSYANNKSFYNNSKYNISNQLKTINNRTEKIKKFLRR